MWHVRFALFLMTVLAAALAQASPAAWRAEGWRTDFSKATVPLSEIVPGGPRRDGIPAINRPKFVPVGTATRYADRERAIVVTVSRAARAYPLSVLTWHEIVNDTIAGVPIAVTYCPLCKVSLVFDRRFGGRLLDFGTTGKLRKSDLIMYDRQTESWWQQFSGEAIVGTFAGRELRIIASRIMDPSRVSRAASARRGPRPVEPVTPPIRAQSLFELRRRSFNKPG